TSVDIEQIFLEGRIILNHLQSSMHPPTFCALLCLSDWISWGVIVAAIKGLPDLGDQDED
ncbi:hypothetical protein C0991_001564, partial [Blastosporella zonata]